MARSKQQEPDYAAELKTSFERWEHLRVDGGSDPFYTDGANMSLVRGHIIGAKMRIEQSMTPEQYPKIYYRETPPEVDRNYMARVDEIRKGAKNSLAIYKANPDYQFLCRRYERLTEKQKKQTFIGAVLGYVSGLEDAINKGDLITMRRHELASRYLDSFPSCAERVRNLKPPEAEQMKLGIDYNDGYVCEEDDEEWDLEA